MSHGFVSRWEEEILDVSRTQPLSQHVSVMRGFLESDDDFQWPEDSGNCSGNHCDIVGSIPLKWKRYISDTKNASIDLYEAGPAFRFQKPFVVKQIRGPDTQKATNMTANEVKNMKDLRHPHITALLATFTHQARLHILIFPAARCDLHQFMTRMSKSLGKGRLTSHSDGTITVDSETTSSRHPGYSKFSSVSQHRGNELREVQSEPWPLITVDKQKDMLRRYFVCLSEALSYLHGSDVRHKDIKPENILIDESGSVILTDFGISRRFEKHTPHATNDEWKFTRKYASPEMMKDSNAFRDDPSDVFSLGCVFLEMATLVLNNNLENLTDYCATIVNESSREEAYYRNLGKVHSWIDSLTKSHGFTSLREPIRPGEINNVEDSHAGRDIDMAAALVDIQQMLDENPSNRPVSKGLWQGFQYISAIRCRDCDPRQPQDIWRPSVKQQRDTQIGLNSRLPLHAIKEKDFRSIEASVSRSPNLSTYPISSQPVQRSPRGSFSSTRKQIPSRYGHIGSEPKPTTLQLNGDIREGSGAIGSSSHLPQKDMVLKETSLDIAQASATSPANSVDEYSTHVRQDQQARAPNRSRATGKDGSVLELQENLEPPQMRIIVYDMLETKAFETDFAFLKCAYILRLQQRIVPLSRSNVNLDQDFRRCPLPKFRQRIDIGDRADLIAKVDLRRLKLKTQMRRWMGSFPLLYVINYTDHPLQPECRRGPGG